MKTRISLRIRCIEIAARVDQLLKETHGGGVRSRFAPVQERSEAASRVSSRPRCLSIAINFVTTNQSALFPS